MITRATKNILMPFLCCVFISNAAYSQKHFYENNSNDFFTENYSILDNTLHSLNWSMIDDKEQKTEFKKYALSFESKKKNQTIVLDTEFKMDIELPTMLTYSFITDELDNDSKIGIMYNYEDSQNFDGFLFDKKNWIVVKCKNGILSRIKSGSNVLKSKYFNVGVCFENGKIFFLLIHSNDEKEDRRSNIWHQIAGGVLAKYLDNQRFNPNYHEMISSNKPVDDNHYTEELYSMKGDLTSNAVGFIISGKNKIFVRGIGFSQMDPSRED